MDGETRHFRGRRVAASQSSVYCSDFSHWKTKFADWYLKIAFGSALIGASMEFVMIETGFYDKVTVLESEKRAWEKSPEAQAIREALNPWRNRDAEASKES